MIFTVRFLRRGTRNTENHVLWFAPMARETVVDLRGETGHAMARVRNRGLATIPGFQGLDGK